MLVSLVPQFLSVKIVSMVQHALFANLTSCSTTLHVLINLSSQQNLCHMQYHTPLYHLC